MDSGDKMEGQVRVGVAVLLRNYEGEYLFIKRQGSHGAGTWAFPGGHIEFGETVEKTAAREVEEELGIKINPGDFFRLDAFTESFIEGKHYITLYLEAETSEIPRIMEPEKCSEMIFISLQTPPGPLFHPTKAYFDAYR